MLKHILLLVSAGLLIVAVVATTACADNVLEIAVIKEEGDGGYVYTVAFFANKEDAPTCQLTSVSGTYTLEMFYDGFSPENDYWPAHLKLTFTELASAISGYWTLTWDQGLATETVAEIDIGILEESDFMPVPVITVPADGATDVAPDTAIEWTYDASGPCTAQTDFQMVFLADAYLVVLSSPELACEVRSWTPGEQLHDGQWMAQVHDTVAARFTADGIGGPVTGDPWILDNEDWLDLQSVGIADFEVTTVITETLSFGDVKALYR